MNETNDLDPTLQQFANRAVAEIAVPSLRHGFAASGGSSRRRLAVTLIAVAVALFVFGSGFAVATGLLSEVFKIGNLSAAGSRAVTLEGARVAQVPLPGSDQLPGDWRIGQVQLTMTETWRSVDLQYRRPGSRGMSIGVWSQGITVNPIVERMEIVDVSGVAVQMGTSGDQRTARFTDQGATVIVRGFASEIGPEELRALVTAWLAQTR